MQRRRMKLVRDAAHALRKAHEVIENTCALRARGSIECEKNAQHYSAVHSEPAEQRNRSGVNFARTRMVHHARAQGELPHRHGQTERRDQANSECEQA